MREDNAFPFQAEGEVKIVDIFTCVYSRQNFSSSHLLCSNDAKGCKQTDSNLSKRFFIQ